jgi:hypothetical protein
MPTEADDLGRGADALTLAAEHGHVAPAAELLRLAGVPLYFF